MATKKTTTTAKKKSVEEIRKELEARNKTGGTLPGTPVPGATLPPAGATTPTTVPGATPSSPTANTVTGGFTTTVGGDTPEQGSAGAAIATIILGTGWKEATATQPGLLNMTGLDALVGRTPGWNATPTIGPKTAVEVIRWARALPAAQFARLQQALYAAGYYPSSMYTNSQVPAPGDRLGDAAWEDALWTALADNARSFDSTRNPDAFGALIEQRKKSFAPTLTAIATQKAEAAAADTTNRQKQAEAEAARNAAAVAEARPADVMRTQLLQLTNPTDIAAAAQDTAVKLLGRRLTPEEESAYVQSIGAAERAALGQQADVNAFNEQLGWTYPNGTATNPTQGTGAAAMAGSSAAQSAPATEYASPSNVPKNMPGYSQLTNPKTNPNATAAFVAMNQKYGVSFLGVVGDAEHQKRKSDHNSWDAVDMGVKNSAVGWNVANDMVAQAQQLNVKYVIFQDKIWTPDKGWHAYDGKPHTGHVHTSFNRATIGPAATSATGPVSADHLAEALALEESGNQNIVTKAKGSSASGFFQITDATWGKYKGYARAIDAPREIQKERATQLLSGYLARFNGDVDMTLAAYYAGGGNSDAKLRSMITNNVNPTAGTQTANKNMQKFLSDVKVNLPKVTTTASVSNPSLGGPGGSLARGVTPYAGAVTTPSGGSVLYQTTPATVANTVEADLRKNNPGELAAQSVLNARAVFQQLFGGI